MITVIGHADLTANTLELLESELCTRLQRITPAQAPALVRARAGLPVVFGRAAGTAGRRLTVVLPSHGALPAPLPPSDRVATGELLLLAQHVRLLPFEPANRDSCVSADERLVQCCRHVLAVWDGSPSDGRDATAHLVAFARSHGVPVEVVWPAEAARNAAPRRPRTASAHRPFGAQVPARGWRMHSADTAGGR